MAKFAKLSLAVAAALLILAGCESGLPNLDASYFGPDSGVVDASTPPPNDSGTGSAPDAGAQDG